MWEKNTKTMYLKAKCFKVQREDVVGLQQVSVVGCWGDGSIV